MQSPEPPNEQGSVHRSGDSALTPGVTQPAGGAPDRPADSPVEQPASRNPAPGEVHMSVTPAEKVKVTCPHCAQGYKISEELIGKAVRCLKCRETFTVTEDVSFWRAAVEEAKTRYGSYDPGKEAPRTVRRGVDED